MDPKVLIMGFLALPVLASAQGFDYTYVEGGYVNSELDTGLANVDGDGLGLRGSLALNDKFHTFAKHATQDLDLDVDTTEIEIGAGRSWRIRENVDFIGEISWVNAEVDTPFGNTDEDGFGLGAGLRARTNSSLELEGRINYVDLNNSDTSFSLLGRYYLWDSFAIGGGLDFDDDDTAWNVGVRAEFGNRD